jgi:hypothetical protein
VAAAASGTNPDEGLVLVIHMRLDFWLPISIAVQIVRLCMYYFVY